MKAKNLQQNASFFLPRIDFPFVTSILLFALQTHTALPQQQTKRFPHPAHSVVLFLSFQGSERRDFRCKKHCSGKRRKRANKSRRRCIARFAKEKSKERRRQNEVLHDAVRCGLRVLSRCQSWLSMLCFAFAMELELTAKKSPSQKRTRPYPVSAQNETETLSGLGL